MKRILYFLILLSCLTSCVDIDEYDDTPTGNFNALWTIFDEHYCFFDNKQQQYGVDWNTVRTKYSAQVDDRMTESQLFEVLCNMLAELHDGHVNLSYAGDNGRYWSFQEDYPNNFSDTLLRKYLSTDYKIASGIRYRILDDNIGYIYYGSFNNSIGEGNLDEVINYLMPCRGLIIDVRDNGGGLLTNAEVLASLFVDESTLVGYMQHKTGTGHSDFSEMQEQRLDPSSNMRWHKSVCVLTNRSVFSAANEFVKYMHALPNVTLVGDQTGGGAGMPYSNSLPNGWSVRFSACPIYDKDKQTTEFGIAPDVKVDIKQEDFMRGLDTIIETARKIIAGKAGSQ